MQRHWGTFIVTLVTLLFWCDEWWVKLSYSLILFRWTLLPPDEFMIQWSTKKGWIVTVCESQEIIAMNYSPWRYFQKWHFFWKKDDRLKGILPLSEDWDSIRLRIYSGKLPICIDFVFLESHIACFQGFHTACVGWENNT